MKDFFKSTKGKIITLASGATVIAIGIVLAVVLQGNGYRSIVVEQTNGQVLVTGEKNNGDAYQGEKLFNGDGVSVEKESSLVMCMDLDKYVYADAETSFGIQASSAKEDSKLKIVLNSGSELNELKSKLGANDTYEVDTPNSTMSVRGTTFRVTVYTQGGLVYSLLEVKEGEVLVKLKTSDGTYNGIEKSFTAGQSALIRGNSDFSEFVVGEESEIILILDYELLPENAVERLIELINCIEDDMIVGDVEAQHIDDIETTEENLNTDENVDADAEEGNDSDVEGSDSENSLDTTTESEESDDASSTSANSTNNNKPKTHTHTASDWTVVENATCLKVGSRQKVCTTCGEVISTESIPTTNHVAGDWVIYSQPDCTHLGSKSQSCIYCGTVLKNEDIPMTGHSYSGWNCTVCGATDPNKPEEVAYIDPTPAVATCSHNWVVVQSPAGRVMQCSICGATQP